MLETQERQTIMHREKQRLAAAHRKKVSSSCIRASMPSRARAMAADTVSWALQLLAFDTKLAQLKAEHKAELHAARASITPVTVGSTTSVECQTKLSLLGDGDEEAARTKSALAAEQAKTSQLQVRRACALACSIALSERTRLCSVKWLLWSDLPREQRLPNSN